MKFKLIQKKAIICFVGIEICSIFALAICKRSGSSAG